MTTRYTPHFVSLVCEAALRSFWRKGTLSAFLTRAGVVPPIALMPDETKRKYLGRTFAQLSRSDRGRAIVVQLAHALAEQASFPDLQGWEDTTQKVDDAVRAVADLRKLLDQQEDELVSTRDRAQRLQKHRESQAKAAETRGSLHSLQNQLEALAGSIGTPEAGRSFEQWFYALMKFSELDAGQCGTATYCAQPTR